jgi:hypothetical protein
VETVITDAAQPMAKPIKPMRNKQEWEWIIQMQFATFRWKETNEIEIGNWNSMTIQMQ